MTPNFPTVQCTYVALIRLATVFSMAWYKHSPKVSCVYLENPTHNIFHGITPDKRFKTSTWYITRNTFILKSFKQFQETLTDLNYSWANTHSLRRHLKRIFLKDVRESKVICYTFVKSLCYNIYSFSLMSVLKSGIIRQCIYLINQARRSYIEIISPRYWQYQQKRTNGQ